MANSTSQQSPLLTTVPNNACILESSATLVAVRDRENIDDQYHSHELSDRGVNWDISSIFSGQIPQQSGDENNSALIEPQTAPPPPEPLPQSQSADDLALLYFGRTLGEIVEEVEANHWCWNQHPPIIYPILTEGERLRQWQMDEIEEYEEEFDRVYAERWGYEEIEALEAVMIPLMEEEEATSALVQEAERAMAEGFLSDAGDRGLILRGIRHDFLISNDDDEEGEEGVGEEGGGEYGNASGSDHSSYLQYNDDYQNRSEDDDDFSGFNDFLFVQTHFSGDDNILYSSSFENAAQEESSSQTEDDDASPYIVAGTCVSLPPLDHGIQTGQDVSDLLSVDLETLPVFFQTDPAPHVDTWVALEGLQTGEEVPLSSGGDCLGHQESSGSFFLPGLNACTNATPPPSKATGSHLSPPQNYHSNRPMGFVPAEPYLITGEDVWQRVSIIDYEDADTGEAIPEAWPYGYEDNASEADHQSNDDGKYDDDSEAAPIEPRTRPYQWQDDVDYYIGLQRQVRALEIADEQMRLGGEEEARVSRRAEEEAREEAVQDGEE